MRKKEKRVYFDSHDEMKYHRQPGERYYYCSDKHKYYVIRKFRVRSETKITIFRFLIWLALFWMIIGGAILLFA